MKRVALFGGSFDPPHNGHIAIIEKLKTLPFIDEVVVMPTYLNPFKEKFHADGKKRLEWLREIFKDDSKVKVSDFEVKQNKAVPTYETVLKLLQTYKKVYVTIGADNVASLDKWYKAKELQELVEFLVITRKGYTIPKKFYTIELDEDISSTQLRKNLDLTKIPATIADAIQKEYNANKN